MNRISSFGDSATAAIRDNPFSAAWTLMQRKSSLLSIFMMGTYAECALCTCILVLLGKHVCVCCSYCICERWRFAQECVGLDSGAGRLILHGLSKWGGEDRSHCSRYRMHPSAWIHMNGQTDLSLLSLRWKRLRCWTQTCIVHLWEHGPIVCLKVQSSVRKCREKKQPLWRVAFYCWASATLHCLCS